jgi:hypothetical protein
MKRIFSWAKISCALTILLLGCSAWAQLAKVSVFAEGFNNPRGLTFGPDGYPTSPKAARWRSLNHRSMQASSRCRPVYRRLYRTNL